MLPERPAPSTLGPLLVATDGSTPSDDAIRAARAIAKRTGQQVELIAVSVPLPMLAPDVQVAQGPRQLAESRSALRDAVMEQLNRTGADKRWHLQVVSGQPEVVIVNAAKRIGASLVIMGLGSHDLFDRLLGEEMVLRVIRLGTVPVLAVAQGFLGLPARIVAATDFSASSVRALKMAETMLQPFGAITVAHALPEEVDDATFRGTDAAYHGTLGRAFDLVLSGLRDETQTERKVLTGHPGTAVLNFAHTHRADLIATGSHGFGFLTRLWLGSVSQELVRGAHCSVLIAPPEDGPSYIDELPSATTRFASYEWAERLEEFTRRNAGRSATMEIIDPDIGAQVENHHVPLVGVDFDPRDASIHLMLGHPIPGGCHLTRSIRQATAVQVLRGKDGADLMLRIAHGNGQTLLTFDR